MSFQCTAISAFQLCCKLLAFFDDEDLSGKKEWFGESFKNIPTLYTERLPLTLYGTELNIDKVCFFSHSGTVNTVSQYWHKLCVYLYHSHSLTWQYFLYFVHSSNNSTKSFSFLVARPQLIKCWINHYPVDKYWKKQLLCYALDRNLSSGQHCQPFQPFEQLGL